jgi:hypothetical protein
MFSKPLRAKLIKHNWLKVAKDSGNESQLWRREKDNVLRAISDIVLLNKKLPQEKRDELYNLQNFKNVFDALLSFENTNTLVKLEISQYLLQKSIKIFKREHLRQNKNTPVSAEIINDYLNKALEICKDIAYKDKIKQTPLEIQKEGIRYLCSWSEVIEREKRNLQDFIVDLTGLMPIKFNLRYIDSKKNKITGDFEDQSGDKCYIELTLGYTKDKANLLIYDKKDYEVKEEITVKQKNNDFLLYYKQIV